MSSARLVHLAIFHPPKAGWNVHVSESGTHVEHSSCVRISRENTENELVILASKISFFAWTRLHFKNVLHDLEITFHYTIKRSQ